MAPTRLGGRARRRALLLAVVVAVGATTAACGRAERDPSATQVADSLRDDHRGTIPAGVTIPGSIPPEQQAFIRDDHVDRAGYEASVNATVACARQRGLRVTDPAPSPSGRFLRYSYSVDTPPGADHEAATALAQQQFAECYLTYQAVVDQLWLRDSQPTEEARRQAIDDMARCLRDDGIDAPDGLSLTELQSRVYTLGPERMDAEAHCLMLHADLFDVPSDAAGQPPAPAPAS